MWTMDRECPYGGGVVRWVSTEWLAAHLNDPMVTILDAQPNVHDYLQEHIPGAAYLNEGLLRVHAGQLPAEYVPQEAVRAVFSRLGLRPDLTAVVYTGIGPFKGWGDGLEQTMVAYSLARFGHGNVCVLDGGIEKWNAEDRPVSKEYPRLEASDFPVSVRSEYFIEYEEFKRIKDQPDVLLLDHRPLSLYKGRGPWMKQGHIPGAVNLPWTDLMEPDNTRQLKPDDQIERILQRVDAWPDKTIICSCGTGREATNPFLLFKWYLGYPKVRLYEGSFTEWCAHPENPTVRGRDPR